MALFHSQTRRHMINNTYTGKYVAVTLVIVLLSYSPYLILPRTYTAYLGPIWFTLDNMDFNLGNMEFTLNNMDVIMDNMTPVLPVQLFTLDVNCFLNNFVCL